MKSRLAGLGLALVVLAATGMSSLGQPWRQIRLRDLAAIRDALEASRAQNGVYPVSAAVSIGDASHPDPQRWIAGLVPRYMAVVPRDPRMSALSSRQYLYMSDGADYKLVAHGVEDAAIVALSDSARIDPRRPSFAYGFWTDRAAQW